MKKIFLILLLLIIIVPIFILGYLGFIPGLSAILGTDKPRDLKVKYTQADLTSTRGKTQVKHDVLPANALEKDSLQRTGSRPFTGEFTSVEITAVLNNQPWKYWPYENVQVKFNADGSAEISGALIKTRIPGYGAFLGAPKEAINFAMKFLPANPVFYLKGKAALIDNKVSVFEPQAFEIGRMSIPVGMFLSFLKPSLIEISFAQDINEMASELSQVQNKKALIISYINSRLSSIGGFYAKNAGFGKNKLIFDGTLPERIATVQ